MSRTTRLAMLGWLTALVTVFAGCADPTPAATDGAALPPPARVLSNETIDWSATIAAQQCGTIGTVYSCGTFGTSVTNPTGPVDAEPTTSIEARGRDLAGGVLALTWQATTPTTDALHVELLGITGCPDACGTLRGLASVTGRSPLELVIPTFDLDDDGALIVRITLTPAVQDIRITPGQDIHLAGTVTFEE